MDGFKMEFIPESSNLSFVRDKDIELLEDSENDNLISFKKKGDKKGNQNG